MSYFPHTTFTIPTLSFNIFFRPHSFCHSFTKTFSFSSFTLPLFFCFLFPHTKQQNKKKRKWKKQWVSCIHNHLSSCLCFCFLPCNSLPALEFTHSCSFIVKARGGKRNTQNKLYFLTFCWLFIPKTFPCLKSFMWFLSHNTSSGCFEFMP